MQPQPPPNSPSTALTRWPLRLRAVLTILWQVCKCEMTDSTIKIQQITLLVLLLVTCYVYLKKKILSKSPLGGFEKMWFSRLLRIFRKEVSMFYIPKSHLKEGNKASSYDLMVSSNTLQLIPAEKQLSPRQQKLIWKVRFLLLLKSMNVLL